ncbi:MAG: alpha/beta hydrolase [Kordiimonadaceae bacterium]|nr:alpha/beta hydrolase [Kordiimonadaceae bacterium]
MTLTSEMVNVGSLNLHVVFAGPEDGEPVILIHGFPEFWYMWRKHMAVLAKAGYRVAAVDMRGYNRSDKPSGRAAYSFSKYAGDITGLMDSQGWSQANIVAHDIGAVVAWHLVFRSAPRVKRAVIYSVGHPSALASNNNSDVSWYRTFFSMPILPELFARAGGLASLASNLQATSRAGTFPEEELEVYKAAWDREHAFGSMLGAYRNEWSLSGLPDGGRPAMPVLHVYGGQDKFIAAAVAEASKQYLADGNVIIHPELSHWLLAEEPEQAAAEMVAFFNRVD